MYTYFLNILHDFLAFFLQLMRDVGNNINISIFCETNKCSYRQSAATTLECIDICIRGIFGLAMTLYK